MTAINLTPAGLMTRLRLPEGYIKGAQNTNLFENFQTSEFFGKALNL